jgi:hypothetical protein
MATFSMIQIDDNEAEADLREALIVADTTNRMLSGQKLMKYIRGLMGGAKSAKVRVGVNAVKSSGTLTLVSAAATNTVTVAGQLFTAVASGATAAQFNLGADDTEAAVSLAAQINAHTTINLWVSATSALGVVTVTALYPGVLGNAIPLLGGTNITASVARLASGTNGAYSATHKYGSAT